MIVGRLTRSRPRSSPFGLPVCVAGVPAAPLCEPRNHSGPDIDALPWRLSDFGRHSTFGIRHLINPMRILSGIQPSGALHIGNYFGMMRPAIALQAEGEALYFIADYHALTTVRDPETLRANSRRVALDFLACGLDPERATLFRHSDVPEVTELAWILSTVAPMGLLERAHSYKDKLARGVAPTVGLFNYPVLMAADILIYDSDVVPVGKDQNSTLR